MLGADERKARLIAKAHHLIHEVLTEINDKFNTRDSHPDNTDEETCRFMFELAEYAKDINRAIETDEGLNFIESLPEPWTGNRNVYFEALAHNYGPDWVELTKDLRWRGRKFRSVKP